MKNTLNKFSKSLLVLFNILLVIFIIWSIAYFLITSKQFYNYEFVKQNVMQRTALTKSQLDIIASHIINYLKNSNDSLQININGSDLFSRQALFHMQDVKSLIISLGNILLYLFSIWVIIAIFILTNRKKFIFHFYKYNFITFLVTCAIFIMIGIFVLIDFEFAFTAFHRILFWDEQSYQDSFFSDNSNYLEAPNIDNRMLVKILPAGLFTDAIAIIVIGSIVILGTVSLIFYIRYKQYAKNFVINK